MAKLQFIDGNQFLGRFYQWQYRSGINRDEMRRSRERYEVIKILRTTRGWRAICIRHTKWPDLGTSCFSLSLSAMNRKIENGEWLLDVASSDPALRVSEGL